MSSKIRPAGETAFQPIRWGMLGQGNAQVPPPQQDVSAAPRVDESVWMQRVEQARAEAFRAGEASAWENARRQTDEAAGRMAAAVADLAAYRSRFRHEAEQQIVDLALAVARKVLEREIHVDPEVLLGVVKAALAKLSLREVLEIRVNPALRDPMQAFLTRNAQGVDLRIQPDPSLPVGALLIETARGVIDASVETQLMEIRRGFADLMERR